MCYSWQMVFPNNPGYTSHNTINTVLKSTENNNVLASPNKRGRAYGYGYT